MAGTILQALYSFTYDLEEPCIPYGTRLALGKYYTYNKSDNDLIDISFNTNGACETAYVLINEIQYPLTSTEVIDMAKIYEDFTPSSSHFYQFDYTYVTYVQRLQIGDLIPGNDYQYRVYGSSEDQEGLGPYSFTIPLREKNTTRVIFFGDMDSQWLANNSKPTFDWLQNQAENNRTQYDALIFMGDMAYDLESEDCQRGDQFLKNISIFTPFWPLMLTPGNHDTGNNTKYSMYRRTFYSPETLSINSEDTYYNFYSFDIGLIHFIAFNPYHIVYNMAKSVIQQSQLILQNESEILFQAFENDLKLVNKTNTPWVVVFSHYPMMCSDHEESQCTKNIQKLSKFYDLMADEYEVQLYVAGHQHNYERSIKDEKLKNNHTYYYDEVPMHVIEGSAGNDRDFYGQTYPPSTDSIFQTGKQSVGILSVLNTTHLYFEQVSTLDNSILDYFFIVRKEKSTFFKTKSRTQYFIGIGVLAIIVIVIIAFILSKCGSKKALEEPLIQQEFEMKGASSRIN